MKDYSLWMNDTSYHEEIVFDMCKKDYVKINNSLLEYESIINDANEWQKDIDNIVLIKKDIYEIKCGDVVSYGNHNYLVVFEPEDRDFYWSAKMRRCNNVLKFYNNYVLKEVPCIVGEGLLSTKTTSLSYSTLIDIAGNHFMVKVPENKDTNAIKIGDRFILNQYAYRIIGVDNVTEVNIITFRVEFTLVTENDNKELGIADFYSNQIDYKISILNGESIEMLYPNGTLQLNVVLEENGISITNPEFIYSSSNPDIIEVDSIGLVTVVGIGIATIKVEYKEASSIIEIRSIETLQDSYSIKLTPEIKSIKVSKTALIKAITKKNGIDDLSKTVKWSMRNEDGSSKSYIKIIPNNRECTLVCESVPNKKVIICAELDYDNSVYAEMLIETANLF